MKKALVIFSGGQDSTTCLYWAKKEFDEIQAITFNYGQKHSIELECSKNICKKLDIKQTILDISFLGSIVKSALTDHSDVNELNEKNLPSSFVPNRNQLFITLAHSLAQKIDYKFLVTGVCQTDYSGYPDCRDNFITAINWATNLGSQADIEIITPLMYLTKKETFDLARDLGAGEYQSIIEDSHTCYNGNREKLYHWGYGCGECPACELRKKGYQEHIQASPSIIYDGTNFLNL